MNGDFANMKGNAICYAWFIWRKGYNGEPTIRWFNTPHEQQPMLFNMEEDDK